MSEQIFMICESYGQGAIALIQTKDQEFAINEFTRIVNSVPEEQKHLYDLRVYADQNALTCKDVGHYDTRTKQVIINPVLGI